MARHLVDTNTPSLRRAIYTYDRCERQLEPQRWIYSRHTHKHYCWPGEGCGIGVAAAIRASVEQTPLDTWKER